MNAATVKMCDTMAVIGRALNLHSFDAQHGFNHAITVGHEISHAILLQGKVDVECDQMTSDRIEGMSRSRANRHEMRTVALHLAGLAALGCACPRVEPPWPHPRSSRTGGTETCGVCQKQMPPTSETR